MSDVRVSRRRPETPAPEAKVTRRRPSGTGMDITVPPAASSISGYAGGETVEIVVRVKADVVEGNIHRGELENWVQSAMYHYHTFRAGFVGLNANAKIRVPRCVRIDKVRDDVE